MVKTSIIVPTYQRERHHANLYQCFAGQTAPDCELLILDDSLAPSAFFSQLQSSNVKYVYSHHKLTIGEKRNTLIDMAQGDLIVHFDDDDYYASNYIETMTAALETADVAKLSGWFAYSTREQKLFYWDTSCRDRYHFAVQTDGVQVGEMNIPHEHLYAHYWGFGFSYAYRRAVWEKQHFEPIDFGEDFQFLNGAQNQGARAVALTDKSGLVLHCLHRDNISRVFPQYYLPPFMLELLFGDAVKPYITF